MVDVYSSPPIDIRGRPLIGVNQLVVPNSFRDDLKGFLLSRGEVQDRVSKLAHDIDKNLYKQDLFTICMLNGAVYFFGDLIKKMDTPIKLATLGSSSYHGENSTGEVTLSNFDYHKITNRDVLIVEDIIDTGRTLEKVVGEMQNYHPKSLKVVCLFDKPSRRLPVVTLQPDYTGFIIPDEFIIGYGLDFNSRYRNLPHVGVLKDELRP